MEQYSTRGLTYLAVVMAILFVPVVAGCGRGKGSNGGEAIRISPVYRYVSEYGALDSLARSVGYEADSTAIDAYLALYEAVGYDSEVLEMLSSSRAVEVFTPAVDSVYPSLLPLEETLGGMVANALEGGLDFRGRKYAAIVSGRQESVVFVDSVVLIALNHYLGADYPGYTHWPAYRRAVKTPEYLPYDLAEALVATAYPYDAPEGSPLLSRLLYEGALAYAKQAIVPGGDRALALGYDRSTMKWLDAHEAELWRTLVASGLLYDISESTASRMVAPTPVTSLLGATVPGRAGRYIGLRIVEAYVRSHPGVSIAELMSPTFYSSQQSLVDAAYRPE